MMMTKDHGLLGTQKHFHHAANGLMLIKSHIHMLELTAKDHLNNHLLKPQWELQETQMTRDHGPHGIQTHSHHAKHGEMLMKSHIHMLELTAKEDLPNLMPQEMMMTRDHGHHGTQRHSHHAANGETCTKSHTHTLEQTAEEDLPKKTQLALQEMIFTN